MPTEINPMSSTTFHLVYDGPALRSNEMSARELSAALIAADDLFTQAGRVLNGERSTTRLVVKASFRTGCFGIEFSSVTHVLEAVKDFFNSDATKPFLVPERYFN